MDQTLVTVSHLWKCGLFSDALKLPEWFLSTQLLCMQLGAEFFVEFRVMLTYRICRGVVTHLSSVNVWMLTPEYEYFQVCLPWHADG